MKSHIAIQAVLNLENREISRFKLEFLEILASILHRNFSFGETQSEYVHFRVIFTIILIHHHISASAMVISCSTISWCLGREYTPFILIQFLALTKSLLRNAVSRGSTMAHVVQRRQVKLCHSLLLPLPNSTKMRRKWGRMLTP